MLPKSVEWLHPLLSTSLTLLKMAAMTSKDDGEAPGSFLSLLTFNTYHMADFAGLPFLLQTHHSHLAFVQEVSPDATLLSLAAATGYSAFFSTSTSPPKRTIAVLACVPVQASALTPGYTQLVHLGDLSFIHLHQPSGGRIGTAVYNCATMLHSLHPFFSSSLCCPYWLEISTV